jgi:hypothetical protein
VRRRGAGAGVRRTTERAQACEHPDRGVGRRHAALAVASKVAFDLPLKIRRSQGAERASRAQRLWLFGGAAQPIAATIQIPPLDNT